MLARLPLRAKLFAASALALVVIAFALTASQAGLMRQALHQQLIDSAAEQQPFIVAALTVPLIERDYASVRAIVEEATRERGLAHLAVADARGNVVAAQGWTPEMADSPVATPLVGPDGRRRIAFRAEIGAGGQPLGRAEFGLSYEPVDAALRTLLLQSLLVMLICLAPTFLLVEALQARLTRPLRELARASERLRRGDYDIELRPSAERDLGALVESFRTMTAEIRDRVGRLTASEAALAAQTVRLEASIAELRDKERVLAATLEHERELTQQQRRFVAVAAHEFRTPLTIIDGAAQRLARQAGSLSADELRARTDKIRKGVARMSELIDSTLSAATLESGSIALRRERVDLGALARSVCARASALAGDVALRVVTDDPVPRVDGDARLLDQVLTNLVSNAVKYSGEGREVDVVVSRDGAEATIAVSDRGIGIPEDEVPRLFQRFFRASTARGIPGTGLGLHLARELVALHGGTITVASRLGAGTTVTVRLPARRDTGTTAGTGAA